MPVPFMPLPAVPMSPAQEARFNHMWAEGLDRAFDELMERRKAERARADLDDAVPLAHPNAPHRVRARL